MWEPVHQIDYGNNDNEGVSNTTDAHKDDGKPSIQAGKTGGSSGRVDQQANAEKYANEEGHDELDKKI